MKTRHPLNTQSIIKQFKAIHGSRYNYSKVNYKGANAEVTIICSIHGEFSQTPTNHKKGCGCQKCARKHRPSTDEVIELFKNSHGNKYDYSQVKYKNQRTKVTIVCLAHGPFDQMPNCHKLGKGCPECSGSRRHTTNDAIEHFKATHGDRYNYSKVAYTNNRTNVTIICPVHGEFSQTPANHKQGNGCPKCALKYRPSTEEAIEQFRAVHGSRYDYSKVEYKNNKEKITIICPKHGKFMQTPSNHKCGNKCPKCQ